MSQEFRRRALVCAIALGCLAFVRAGSPAVSAAKDDHRDDPRKTFKVGHTVIRLCVPYNTVDPENKNFDGCAPTQTTGRQVDVHLWYPAEPMAYAHAPVTEYTSALNGAFLSSLWDPLSWKVVSLRARENPAILDRGFSHPVIVFSHGNTNMPIDYAFTLEEVASGGFVVAAPTHVNNSEDDVRMDFANNEAIPPPFTCRDGLPSPCLHTNVARNMAERVRDITSTLDALRDGFGTHVVDMGRVGVFGHSRGTVTALTAAGGSTTWRISPERRIRAVMGMAIGAPNITAAANIGLITQPTLLVSGLLDTNTPPSVSEGAYNALPASTDKALVYIEKGMHRTFDSTLCEQMQSAAAIAQNNARALLDLHTASGILFHPTSGVAMNYCGRDTFTTPVDVTAFVGSVTGFNFMETAVPTTGLTTARLRPCISGLAVRFFEHALGAETGRSRNLQDDWPHDCRDIASLGASTMSEREPTGDVTLAATTSHPARRNQ